MKTLRLLMIVFCGLALSATSAFASSFGNSGWDGSGGRDGYSGRSGLPVSLSADGSYQTVDVTGEDGTDAEDGEYGEDARFCSQPRNATTNLRGADGGDGGDGGAGGRGGDSGEVTVFFNNDADLKNITIFSVPGRGGYAGQGRSGGRGCDCSRRSWQVTDREGNVRTFHCTDGSDGWRGRRGFDGSTGIQGYVKIVKGRTSIPTEKPAVSKSIEHFASQTTNLSNNIWVNSPNGRDLFANNSVMPSNVEQFTGVATGSFNILWESTRPLSHFSNASASVSIDDASNITFNPAANLAMEYSEQDVANGKDVIVHEAVYVQELESIVFANAEGKGRQIVLNLNDTAEIGDLVNTSVHLKYQTQKFIVYGIRYEDFVPANALVIENDRIAINIGALPIDEKYLKGGTYTKVKIKIVRDFAGKSREKEIKEKFQIIKD